MDLPLHDRVRLARARHAGGLGRGRVARRMDHAQVRDVPADVAGGGGDLQAVADQDRLGQAKFRRLAGAFQGVRRAGIDDRDARHPVAPRLCKERRGAFGLPPGQEGKGVSHTGLAPLVLGCPRTLDTIFRTDGTHQNTDRASPSTARTARSAMARRRKSCGAEARKR